MESFIGTPLIFFLFIGYYSVMTTSFELVREPGDSHSQNSDKSIQMSSTTEAGKEFLKLAA
jgi:hypothetical protein